MNWQLAKKRDVWRKEKVSKASMGYTRKTWLPPGILSPSVLILALLLKIFTNICQHFRERAQYFEQARRRSIGVRQNLLPSSRRCFQMICLLSSRKFELAALSLVFSGSGSQILTSLRNPKHGRRLHETLCLTAHSLIFLHHIALYHRYVLLPTTTSIALHHDRSHLLSRTTLLKNRDTPTGPHAEIDLVVFLLRRILQLFQKVAQIPACHLVQLLPILFLLHLGAILMINSTPFWRYCLRNRKHSRNHQSLTWGSNLVQRLRRSAKHARVTQSLGCHCKRNYSHRRD